VKAALEEVPVNEIREKTHINQDREAAITILIIRPRDLIRLHVVHLHQDHIHLRADHLHHQEQAVVVEEAAVVLPAEGDKIK
jgi:hypothetical protein